MIFIDFNQLIIANVCQHVASERKKAKKEKRKVHIDEFMIRHMVLNTLRSYNVKFAEYGEIVVCCDTMVSWRKVLFPYYKISRKKARDESTIDWPAVFSAIDRTKQELKEFFPYRVIDVEGAEGDDVIGTLVPYLAELDPDDKQLILSSDGDFVQLQRYGNVIQWSPTQKKFVKTDDPIAYLKEHVIRGDFGDRVPNILSPDDVFAIGGRQTPISEKKFNELVAIENLETDEQLARNWLRNKTLIDLAWIPKTLQDNIIAAFHVEPRKRSKQVLMEYMIEHKLSGLIDKLGDF